MADMNALVRNPIVLGGAAVLVIAVAAGGYFLGRGSSGGSSAPKSAQEALAARGVCEATLARVEDYGILRAGASLTSKDATDTDTAKRVICKASSDGTAVTITVDVPCDNMADEKCLKLFKITNASGTLLYQRTKFLDPT